MTTSSIADKISKLIAKAESSSHPDEADTFMAKVHQLLEQHGLDLQQVGKLQSDDPVGRSNSVGAYFASESAFRDVAFAAARYYGCQGLVASVGSKRYVHVVGRQSARTTFELMWPYLKRSIRAKARQLEKEEGSTFARQRRWVADALTARINKLLHEREFHEARKEVVTTGVNALVPVDLIEQMTSHAKVVRGRNLQSTSGAIAAAAGIGLDLQTTGKAVRKITG